MTWRLLRLRGHLYTAKNCKSDLIDECGEWKIEVETDTGPSMEMTNISVQCGNHRFLYNISTFVCKFLYKRNYFK